MKKVLGFISAGVYVFIVSFLATFVGSLVASAVNEVLDEMRLHHISYWQLLSIAKSSAIYGLCVVWAVFVVSAGTVLIRKFIWPALKCIGFKIRYFFHGY